MIIKEVKSLSAIFKLDNDVFYNIIDEVLKPFASQEYMSLDDFDRVVKKVKTGMIDYLVQTKSPVFSKSIITNLISGQNNIGKQLSTLQKKYPESELLSNFETRFSRYEEGAVTVTMKAKPSDAATTNRYIAMMRELKALEPEFYKNLVLVSLLQGTYDTRIAINKIVPLEDRAEIIAPLINATYSQADLQNFSRQGVFFRTNFSDNSIVPEYTPKFLVKEGQFGYERTGFIKLDGTDSTPGNGRVLRLSKAYSRFNNAEMDFLKVKRYQYAKGFIFDITGERKPIRWRLTKGETGIDFATLVQNGEVNQYEMVGYKKVKDSSGEPLTDEKDNVYFKMVNLYGDGDLVKLYRIDGLPSTIKNNTYPVKQELSDDTIIKAVNNEIISSPERIIEQPTEVSQQSSQVYSQLGNKTQSENIVISNIKTKDGKYDREANIKEAQENNRIYSMETNSNLSFSNPWASFKRGDTINTSTTKEAVQNYIDWLITDKFKDIKPERRAWILNQLKLGSLKGKTIQYYAELNEPSHATALDYLINKYDWSTVAQPTVETSQVAGQPRKEIQPGFFDYGLLSKEDEKLILDEAIKQTNKQGYPVKKGVVYAHWGNMWAVTDKGADAFPIFGKYLRRSKESTGSGKGLKKIDLPKSNIQHNDGGKGWYDYYPTDQNGNPLTPIPQAIKDILEKKLGIDMSVFDSAIINSYGETTELSRHIDNTEDKGYAYKIPIVSISLIGDSIFQYSSPSDNPTHYLPDDKSVSLKPGQVVVFGGPSRAMAHRVLNGKSGGSVNIKNSISSLQTERINITLRRALPLSKEEYDAWVNRNQELKTTQQPSTPTTPEQVVPETPVTPASVRIIKVDQYNIAIAPDGRMYYNKGYGREVEDQTIKNKVSIRKELQDKTLRISTYNKSEYFVLSDDRIVGSGKTNLGKETVTDPNIRKKILMKAILYKKTCKDAL
jgi:alkylated DNA repair dioxygenase AlkB